MSKKSNSIFATLVRGEDYTLNIGGGNALVFPRGVAKPVTAEQRAHLERHAIDFVTRPGRADDDDPENVQMPKFVFTEESASELAPA